MDLVHLSSLAKEIGKIWSVYPLSKLECWLEIPRDRGIENTGRVLKTGSEDKNWYMNYKGLCWIDIRGEGFRCVKWSFYIPSCSAALFDVIYLWPWSHGYLFYLISMSIYPPFFKTVHWKGMIKSTGSSLMVNLGQTTPLVCFSFTHLKDNYYVSCIHHRGVVSYFFERNFKSLHLQLFI